MLSALMLAMSGAVSAQTITKDEVARLMCASTNIERRWFLEIPATNGMVCGTNGFTDEFIRGICKDGTVCRAIGHKWENAPVITLMYYPDGAPEKRRCVICGKEQMRSMEDWK